MRGCTDPRACNYKFQAAVDDDSCEYKKALHDCNKKCVVEVDCNGVCGGGASKDFCGVCGGDNSGCTGCMDKAACNYDPSAKVKSRKCVYKSKVCGVCGGDGKACTGCGEASACNFDKDRKATDNSKCVRAKPGFDCQKNCVVGVDCKGTCGGKVKFDACGVCGGNNSTCTGCMDVNACNYDRKATIRAVAGTCKYPRSKLFDCQNKCRVKEDCNGLCGGSAKVDSCGKCGGDGGSCRDKSTTTTAGSGSSTTAGSRATTQATTTLSGSPVTTVRSGCRSKDACNYDSRASVHNPKMCRFAKKLRDCSDNCLVAVDCNGVCGGQSKRDVCGVCGGDNSKCCGCTDKRACNYAASAIVSCGTCVFGKSKVCGVCGGDGKACTGCKDKKACNYDAKAKFPGPCRYPAKGKKDGS